MSKFTRLKVKILSLEAESKIIRLQEQQVLSNPKKIKKDGVIQTEVDMDKYVSLRNHRIYDIRKEQRSAFLAYGYVRGREYKQIEQPNSSEPDWGRVAEIVKKFVVVDGDLGLLSVDAKKQVSDVSTLKLWKEGGRIFAVLPEKVPVEAK